MITSCYLGPVAICLLAIIVTVSGHVNAYRKFGQDCRDISCAGNERCIVSHVACERDQRDGEHCGLYPRCVERAMNADQQLIDTTSTTANTLTPIYSPITSTIQLNHQLNHQLKIKPHTDFELLNQESFADPAESHAKQLQANVLVVLQDGAKQPNINPNQNQNFYTQPWRQYCSPYYPYTCNYPSSPYLPSGPRSVPSYPNARAGNGRQLMPPAPPCYYNCYPRFSNSYPLGTSVRPSSLINNYLMYITI
ncbi:uncharacterized protein LOC117788518 [Drosophila innubila]|uniref:uncharacterized protein LOC117788518 n=1 Tax=Drosophila innubila TaxID=198719 RepID=UPI00148B7E37|nr:uncharacterized protein LOC117788518 [Drosophila innubila]